MAVIAIDADNTIFEEWYPDVGPLIPGAKETINHLYNSGHTIIIWTCREGEQLDPVIDALDMYGIKYHYINTNAPEKTERYGWDSRKIGCDILIDDRSVYFKALGGIDWSEIDKMLTLALESTQT